MTQQQRKNWVEGPLNHIKNNFIPLLGIIGSFVWFVRTADAHWIKLETNQANSIEFQKKTTVHLDKIDVHLNNLDTLRYQIRDLRNEMNYKLQIESVKHMTNYFTESYLNGRTGKPVLTKVK